MIQQSFHHVALTKIDVRLIRIYVALYTFSQLVHSYYLLILILKKKVGILSLNRLIFKFLINTWFPIGGLWGNDTLHASLKKGKIFSFVSSFVSVLSWVTSGPRGSEDVEMRISFSTIHVPRNSNEMTDQALYSYKKPYVPIMDLPRIFVNHTSTLGLYLQDGKAGPRRFWPFFAQKYLLILYIYKNWVIFSVPRGQRRPNVPDGT